MAARLACFSIALTLWLAPIARADDQTHYEIGAYIWGTSLASQIDTSDGHTSLHIPFSALLKHISGGLQLHGRAGERQLKKVDLGLTENLGGHPHQNVCAVSIIGRQGA